MTKEYDDACDQDLESQFSAMCSIESDHIAIYLSYTNRDGESHCTVEPLRFETAYGAKNFLAMASDELQGVWKEISDVEDEWGPVKPTNASNNQKTE